MGKAATSGQFRNLIGSLNMIPEEAINQIDGALIQKAIDQLPSGITAVEFMKWINNGCCLQVVMANAFTVGNIFRHRAEQGDRRLYLSDNTQNWLIKPNLKKVIPIRTDLRKLTDYKLPKNMNDSTIAEKAGNPGCMTEEEFLQVMYLLIFQPELGKQVLGFALKKSEYYIFHVMVNGKKVAFDVDWDDDGWRFNAGEFGGGDAWPGGARFISFATA